MKKAAVSVNCRQPLGAERPPADTDREARALIPMTTRKFIIPITLVSLEVDPYPVKPPDEKAAQLTLGEQPFEVLSRRLRLLT